MGRRVFLILFLGLGFPGTPAIALEKSQKKPVERISLDSSPTFKKDAYEVQHQKIEEEKIMLQNQVHALDHNLETAKIASQEMSQQLNEKTKTLSLLISRFYLFCQSDFSWLLTQGLSSLLHAKMRFQQAIQALQKTCLQLKKSFQDSTLLEKTILAQQAKYKDLLEKVQKEGASLREKRLQQLQALSQKYQLHDEDYSYTMALNMPAQGELLHPSKKSGKSTNTKKIKIKTGYSTEVVSPTYGTVNYIGPLEGSVVAVIIDHGGGYHSILYNLESVTVTVGKALYPGEVIGKMAGYGKHHPILTFEFRGQEGALDPLPGLRRGGLS